MLTSCLLTAVQVLVDRLTGEVGFGAAFPSHGFSSYVGAVQALRRSRNSVFSKTEPLGH
jgi:hypothetical protein